MKDGDLVKFEDADGDEWWLICIGEGRHSNPGVFFYGRGELPICFRPDQARKLGRLLIEAADAAEATRNER